MLGDFNARTGTLSDRIETTDTMYEDGTVMLDNDDASCTTSQSRRVRSNSDKVINQIDLIDMCRILNLHILMVDMAETMILANQLVKIQAQYIISLLQKI